MKKLSCLVLSVILFLCACSVPELEEITAVPDAVPVDTTPDTSVFGVAFASNSSADPYTSSNKLNTELMGLICEPLFSVSESFEVSEVLCSEYSYSDKAYKFIIKDGVTFSDGSTLRPSDVSYSLLAAMEPSSYYATRLGIIESVSASNRGGYVTVTLKYDNARFPALLDIPIIKEGTRGEMLPVGTGIYAPNESLSALTARSGHHSGKTPKYPSVNLYDVASSDELVFEFDTHNVSVLTSDPTGTAPITPSSVVSRTNVPSTQFQYLGFNTKSTVLSDKTVRQAIAKAIDRESAATSDFALMGHAAALPVHPVSSSYPSEYADAFAYDGETPLPITEPLTILVNSENSGKLAVCNRIAASLSKLGAPTTVRALPFDEYTLALQNGDFTLYYAEVSLGADFDITRLISGSLNFGGFNDAAMLAANSAYLSGDEGRDEYFRTFCDTVPFAPILFKDTAIYTQKNFFAKLYPSSQNVYHRFCDWVTGG